jgi:hypothetical protein
MLQMINEWQNKTIKSIIKIIRIQKQKKIVFFLDINNMMIYLI